MTVDLYAGNTVLTVRRAVRQDSGRYRLLLSNTTGSWEGEAEGVVLGPPQPPAGPLAVTKLRAKHASLAWQPSPEDGGSPVTGYALERQEEESGRWVPCGEVGPGETQAKVEGLTPGKRYKFRVRAVNSEGESEPLTSQEAVTAGNPYTVPDPPQYTEITDWDNTMVLLVWKPPASDGGRPVTHYIIEQKVKL